MKYLRIISKFSIAILLVGSLSAQDLEDDFIKIKKTSDTSFSEELEMAGEEEVIDAIKVPTPRLVLEELPVIVQKKEQLGIVARKALYQKLTTPRWVSIISADTWKQSFIKWRYYAQLRNHIIDIDNDLTYLKEKQQESDQAIAFVPHAAVESVEKELNGAILEELLVIPGDTILDAAIVVNEPIAQSPLDISKEEKPISGKTDDLQLTTEESIENPETWEDNERGSYSFSLDDLRLPDSVASEHEIWLQEEEERLYRDSVLLALSKEVLESPEEVKVEKLSDLSEDRKDQKQIEKEEIEKTVIVVTTQNPKEKSEQKELAQQEPKPSPVSNREIGAPDIKKPTSAITERSETTVRTPVVITPPIRFAGRRKAQTAAFERKKGQLALPVMAGSISKGYGITRNSTGGGLQVRNNGIDFLCPPSSSVLSVHNGTVLMVSPQSGYSNVVTVKHGDYASAYYHLGEVNVKVGDVVAIGQRLGRLKSGAAEVPFHFEIWKDQDKVNPEVWLGSQ